MDRSQKPTHPLDAPSRTSGEAMTHHRNFYFEKVTTGPALRGDERLIRPHVAGGASHDSNIVLFPVALSPPGAMENLPDGAETVRSFIPDVADQEFAAAFFACAAFAAPMILTGFGLAVWILFFE
jgi:hypothetical protein